MQDETGNIYILRFGASYIRDFTVLEISFNFPLANELTVELLAHHCLVLAAKPLIYFDSNLLMFFSQMVSHSATLRHLVQFTDINKPYCLRSLLELIHGFTPKLRYSVIDISQIRMNPQ